MQVESIHISTSTQEELWKNIDGFPGYQVSSFGNVRSCRRGEWHIMKQVTRMDGYRTVRFCLARKIYTRPIHRLVAVAFYGPPQPRQEVLHEDDNPANNRLENLRWGTHAENMAQMSAKGRASLSECFAKLTREKVADIRSMLAAGNTLRKVAATFGVCHGTISNIKQGRKWKGR